MDDQNMDHNAEETQEPGAMPEHQEGMPMHDAPAEGMPAPEEETETEEEPAA